MKIETFYHIATSTFTHVVIDEATRKSAVIDSVLDYDQYSGTVGYESADRIAEYILEHNLQNEWIIETHIHADHITAAHYLKEKVGGAIAMGTGIKKVLALWVPKFDNENDTATDGSQFDELFDDGDSFDIGNLKVTVWHTPGHTPACASYLIDDVIFVGDTLFAPHLGTARCDFPGGSAKSLYNTIQRFYQQPENTRLYLAHDYPQEGDKPVAMVAVAQSKAHNKMIDSNTSLAQFMAKRQARDATLAVPKLLMPAIQANMRNGQFGAVSERGVQFVKIPVSYSR